jgi:hypothetical protein
MEAATFTHTPRPALVPPESRFASQRRFGPAGISEGMPTALYSSSRDGDVRIEVEVFRHAERDVAEVSFGVHALFSAVAHLTPAKLRDLASRLIDAAHDIEANPAPEML